MFIFNGLHHFDCGSGMHHDRNNKSTFSVSVLKLYCGFCTSLIKWGGRFKVLNSPEVKAGVTSVSWPEHEKVCWTKVVKRKFWIHSNTLNICFVFGLMTGRWKKKYCCKLWNETILKWFILNSLTLHNLLCDLQDNTRYGKNNLLNKFWNPEASLNLIKYLI